MNKQVKYEGELDLNGFIIPCYVLEDGARIISGNQMQEALKLFPDAAKIKSGSRLARLLAYESIKSLIANKYDPGHFEPIICYNGNQKINGYEATVLADICEIMLDARVLGLLTGERQKQIANQCEILIRSFARVGIIALVDEATGYQKDKNRAKDELQKFLKQFMREDAARWIKRFEDSFFEMIYRMRGWTWNYTHKHPGVVGVWINDIVYERVAPLVLSELKAKNPVTEKGSRKNKHHVFLTDEIGIPKLLNHLAAVEALGRASGYDWNRFMTMLDKAFPKQYQQLSFIFDETLPQTTKNPELSDLNEKLTKAIEYNPKKLDTK